MARVLQRCGANVTYEEVSGKVGSDRICKSVDAPRALADG
jgi:hypothetical protein